MTWREDREELLSEAREILKDKTFAKASTLHSEMFITGAMAASLLRQLGFEKYSSKTWRRKEIEKK